MGAKWFKNKINGSRRRITIIQRTVNSIIVINYFISLRSFVYREEDDDGNAAVEGPIPLEPDEKLYGYKRDESKVRQL